MAKRTNQEEGITQEDYEREMAYRRSDEYLAIKAWVANSLFAYFHEFARREANDGFPILDALVSPRGQVRLRKLRLMPLEQRLQMVDLVVRLFNEGAPALSGVESKRHDAFCDGERMQLAMVGRESRRENRSALRKHLIKAVHTNFGETRRSTEGPLEFVVPTARWHVGTMLDFGGRFDVDFWHYIQDPTSGRVLSGNLSFAALAGIPLGDKWTGTTEDEAPEVTDRIVRSCKAFIETAARIPGVGTGSPTDILR